MKSVLRRTGFWLLLPLSALQGLRLRSTALRLPEAAGDRAGVTGNGETLHLLAMGDSIIAGVGTAIIERSLPVQFAQALAQERFSRVHWRVEGANGAKISDLRQRLSNLDDKQQADIVLISIGVNDVTGLSSTGHWKKQLELLAEDLRLRWPEAFVIFAGLPPMSKFPLPPQPLRFTLGLRAAVLDNIAGVLISGQSGMLHVPTEIDPIHHEFCEDGFHPSAETCRFWAREITQRLDVDSLTHRITRRSANE